MNRVMLKVALACAAALATVATAQAGTERHAKDIVLAPLMQPAAQNGAAGQVQPVAAQDGMAVSVLLETPQGVLVPHSAETVLQTGTRFRVKILTAREGDIDLYNTNPLGVTSPQPIWSGHVEGGLETLTPPLQLTGNRGEDQLHVVLRAHAASAPTAFAWLQNLTAGKSAAVHKDIRLVTENTEQATYVYNPAGQGSVVTLRIRHQ